MLDVLSMGQYCLDDKNVKLLLRLIGTYYYNTATLVVGSSSVFTFLTKVREIKDVSFNMTVAKDIRPLYDTLYKVWKVLLSELYSDTTDVTQIALVSLLCLFILKCRIKNRDWYIYKNDIPDVYIYKISDGNISVYTPDYIEGSMHKITDMDDFYNEYSIPTIEEIEDLPQEVLLPGSDIASILTTINKEEGLGRSYTYIQSTIVLEYKKINTLNKIGSQALRNSDITYFSGIPDLSKFR